METILEQSDSGASGATVYNFGRAGHLTHEQMRAIGVVNDQFARALTHTLGAWLRTQMQIGRATTEQMPFSDFATRLPNPCYVYVLRLEPLGGVGLLELDLTVAMTIVDLLLGGQGTTTVIREVSEIEDAILASVLGLVLKELNAAWDSAGLKFTLEKHEAQAKVIRLMPPGDQTLCVSLEMQMLGAQGMLNVCLPAVVLNTIHRRMSVLMAQPRSAVAATLERTEMLMAGAAFKALVRMPTMRLASRVIHSLEVGQVLVLPLPRNSMAEILVAGVRLCSALPVAKGDRCGALLQADAADRAEAVSGSDGDQKLIEGETL